MVAFNPNLPDIEPPNYAYMARPIRPPHPSMTGEAIGKGAADVLNIGLKGADYVHKTNIDNELHQKLDEWSQQRLSEVYNEEDSLVGRGNLPEEGGSIDPKVMMDMTNRLDRADKLFDYGKFSQVRYDAERAAIVSSVRAKYPSPADRDLIDSKAATYYREDPTNQVIRGKLAQFNYLFSRANSQSNKLREEAYKTPGGAAAYQQYEKNPTPENRRKVDGLIANWMQMEAQEKYDKIVREQKKANGEDTSKLAAKNLNEQLSKRMLHVWDSVKLGSGLNIEEYLQKVASGEITPSQEQWATNKTAILGVVDAFEAGASKWAAENYTARDLGKNGAEEVQKAIKGAGQPLRDFATDIDKNGGFALARLEALKHKNEYFAERLKEANPEAVAEKEFANTSAKQSFSDAGLKYYNKPEALATFYNIYKDVYGHEASSFKTVADIANKPDSPMTDKEKTQAVRMATEIINRLPQEVKEGLKPGGPGPENALKLNDYLYNPKNLGVLDDFKMEDGKTVKAGRMAAYGALTNPKLLDASWKLREAGHPEAWQNAVNFTKDAARGLVKSAIDDIRHFHDQGMFNAPSGPSARGSTVWDKTYIGWNDQTSQFEFHSDIPKSIKSVPLSLDTTFGDLGRAASNIYHTNPHSAARDALEAKVNQVNEVLGNFKALAQIGGGDVNDSVLNFLINDVGLDPQTTGVRFSDDFIKSIRNSKLRREGTQLRTNEGP